VSNSDVTTGLLAPELLARLKSLQLRARRAVDGSLTGLHRSPHFGASVEFAEHKEYAPGDEIRHLDWRVFAKSDKYYVKRYEQETNLQATLLVDTSSSMLYQSPDALCSKWDYTCTISAAIAYILLLQQDSVGLVLVGSDVQEYIPPRNRSSHLVHLCEQLVRHPPKPRTGTNLLKGAQYVSEVLPSRGIVFVLSDFLDTDPRFFDVLKRVQGRGRQVYLLHVLDPWEVNFPFDDMTLFRSLESGRKLMAEPRAMRTKYLEAFQQFLSDLREGARAVGMDHRLLRTDEPFEHVMTSLIRGSRTSTVGGPDGS